MKTTIEIYYIAHFPKLEISVKLSRNYYLYVSYYYGIKYKGSSEEEVFDLINKKHKLIPKKKLIKFLNVNSYAGNISDWKPENYSIYPNRKYQELEIDTSFLYFYKNTIRNLLANSNKKINRKELMKVIEEAEIKII